MITIIRRRFFEALEAKTGWGKEELKRLFDDIVIQSQAEAIEKASGIISFDAYDERIGG